MKPAESKVNKSFNEPINEPNDEPIDEPIDEQIAATHFDSSLIEYNLSLTPEQRLENHQRSFETIQELKKAREQIYAESKYTPQSPA